MCSNDPHDVIFNLTGIITWILLSSGIPQYIIISKFGGGKFTVSCKLRVLMIVISIMNLISPIAVVNFIVIVVQCIAFKYENLDTKFLIFMLSSSIPNFLIPLFYSNILMLLLWSLL